MNEQQARNRLEQCERWLTEKDKEIANLSSELEKLKELRDFSQSLREQVAQMRSMFNDDDGSIEKACSDFDKFANS